MATIKSFEELEIWQIARELANNVFDKTQLSSPLSKDFSLKDQMNRSSGSIMDNISEGFGRGSRLEFVQFLSIAKASATELQSQLVRCLDRKYLKNDEFVQLNEIAFKVGNKIAAFMKYLNTTNIKGQKFLNRGTENEKQPTPKNAKRQTPNNENKEGNKKNIEISNNTKQQTPNNIINSKSAATPLGAYPHARKVGNLLFLSGIGSRNAKDNSIPGLELDSAGNILKYDIEAECHQCFANVKAVLEASGSSWDKIIDVTVFLTNMKNDFPLYNKIYTTYFESVQACRTTVEVKSLPTPIAIELKVIAAI
ncbi:MAG: four helix bundle protein [Ferruginibacter sp.]